MEAVVVEKVPAECEKTGFELARLCHLRPLVRTRPHRQSSAAVRQPRVRVPERQYQRTTAAIVIAAGLHATALPEAAAGTGAAMLSSPHQQHGPHSTWRGPPKHHQARR